MLRACAFLQLKGIDLRDAWQCQHLLRKLIDKDVEATLQRHLAHVRAMQHVVGTTTGKSRARGRARVEQEGDVPAHLGSGGGPEESVYLDAEEFVPPTEIPPTVMCFTSLFPELEPEDFLTPSEMMGGSWNFWIGIERLNKDLWLPELLREDRELKGMATSFIRWYIGENAPVVLDLQSGKKELSNHSYLEPLKELYRPSHNDPTLLPGGAVPGGAGAGDGTALNDFRWFPPEMLCPKCMTFRDKNTTPSGFCARCGLPPHYTRTDQVPSRATNRYHVTTSYTSMRCKVDLLLVHAMFRSISLRAHYAGRSRRVPLHAAWNQALDEAEPVISKMHKWGCTHMGQLPRVPLARVGVPGRSVLLIRAMLWHVDRVLKWMRRRTPFAMTLHSPTREEKAIMAEDARLARKAKREAEDRALAELARQKTRENRREKRRKRREKEKKRNLRSVQSAQGGRSGSGHGGGGGGVSGDMRPGTAPATLPLSSVRPNSDNSSTSSSAGEGKTMSGEDGGSGPEDMATWRGEDDADAEGRRWFVAGGSAEVGQGTAVDGAVVEAGRGGRGGGGGVRRTTKTMKEKASRTLMTGTKGKKQGKKKKKKKKKKKQTTTTKTQRPLTSPVRARGGIRSRRRAQTAAGADRLPRVEGAVELRQRAPPSKQFPSRYGRRQKQQPVRRYTRPTTAPNWSLGGGLEVNQWPL